MGGKTMGFFSEFAFEQLTEQRSVRKKDEQKRTEFLRVLLETGATPDGQIVLPNHLFPVQQIAVVA